MLLILPLMVAPAIAALMLLALGGPALLQRNTRKRALRQVSRVDVDELERVLERLLQFLGYRHHRYSGSSVQRSGNSASLASVIVFWAFDSAISKG